MLMKTADIATRVLRSRIAEICKSYLLLLALLVGPDFAHALAMDTLHQAQVPVRSQSKADRDDAIQAALAAVVVKLTGSSRIAEIPGINEVLKKAPQLVQQYRYAEKRVGLAVKQELWVAFDAAAVNQVLQNAGVPVWGRMRPALVVWLAIDDGPRRYLLGGDERPEITAAMIERASQRGLPLVTPLLDMEDRAKLNFTDVWANIPDKVRAASERYQSEAILVGRISGTKEGVWRGKWNLTLGANNSNWESKGVSIQEAAVTGMDMAAETLARRYAQVFQAENDNVELTIMDVANPEGYAKVTQYLQSLDGVAAVAVAAVQGTTVRYQVTMQTNPEALSKIIGFSNILLPAQDTAPLSTGDQSSASANFVYRLQP